MIGNSIKRLRTEQGMTQKNLADKLFVSAQAVSRWENEEVEPSINTVMEMAKIFGVTTDEIFGVEHPKEEPQVIVEKEKEYVYKEPPKQVLALCEHCNSPIYDPEDIVRTTTYDTDNSSMTTIENHHIFCKKCDEEKKERIRQKKLAKSKKNRILSFVFGPLAAVLAVVLFVVIAIKNNMNTPTIIIVSAVMALAIFELVSCCILGNNFVGDMIIDIFSWGFVKMPGLIFTLDLDGIIWLLTVKLLFWILGIVLAVACGLLGIAVGAVVSLFVYPYAINKNIKSPEKIELF